MSINSPSQILTLERRIAELETTIKALQHREQAVVEFQEKLKILNEVSIQLDRAESFDELCRLSIKLGMERLGFERLGLWFLDEKREFLHGTFGVDEEGNIRDERHTQWVTKDFIEDFSFDTNKIMVNSDTVLYNDKSKIVGRGWHIAVPLLDGNEFVGCMASDNLIYHQPMEVYQPELLQLYGSTIGYMARSKQEQDKVQKLLQVIEYTSTGIALMDVDGHIEYMNSAFQTISGLIPNEMLNNNIEEFLQLADCKLSYKHILQTLSKKQHWHSEWNKQTVSGDSVNIWMSISAIQNQSGATSQFMMMLEDITAHREVEQQQRRIQLERERTHILETFIQDVAHEFKTPLSIINTKSYLLKRTIEDEKVHERVNNIMLQSEQMNHILDDMVKVVKLDQGVEYVFEIIDLSKLLSECLALIQHHPKSNQLQWNIQLNDTIRINGDWTRLSDALLEILENAIQYTPIDGAISVQIRQDAQEVYIDIQDTGVGMVKDELDAIFAPLYRIDKARTERGAGVGLTIAKKIIEEHYGTIVVRSEPTVGTTFTIRFPVE